MRSFPDEFRMGMKARKDILGDDGLSAPENWDPIWQDSRSVHMLVTINGQSQESLTERYEKIIETLEKTDAGVELLTGHCGINGANNLPYQSGNAIVLNGKPTANEHSHYTDGISDPVFKGQGRSANETIGAGRPTRGSATTPAGWEALETGEFLLVHRDETCEYPVAPEPRLLSYNGRLCYTENYIKMWVNLLTT